MKKILSLLLVVVLMMASFVGCFQKEVTAKELFEQALEKNQGNTNAEFEMDMTFNMSGLEAAGLAGPIGLSATGQIKDPQNMALAFTVEIAGQPIDAALYMSDNEMLLQSNMLMMFTGTQYVKADLAALAEQAGAPIAQPNPDKVIAVLERFTEQTDYDMYDIIKLSDAKVEEEITVNEESVKTTKLTAKIDLTSSTDMLVDFMKFIVSDEEAKTLFFGSLSETDIAELEAVLDDEATIAGVSAAVEMFKFNKFDIELYLDEDLNTVAMNLLMDVSFTDETTGESFDMDMSAMMKYFNYGGVTEIEFPEYDESEVLDLSTMLP